MYKLGCRITLEYYGIIPLFIFIPCIQVFTSPEDTSSVKGAKVAYDDPDVERVRRYQIYIFLHIPLYLFILC